jgi:hypothetical protein
MPTPHRDRILALVLAAAASAFSPSLAAAITEAIVPGKANPNLAGRANGYACCTGDSAPDESPTLVTQQTFHGCDYLEFNVTGRVSFEPGTPTGNNPDGDSIYSMINYGDGLSAPKSVRANALVGVFLDASSPTGKTTPASLDFTDGLDFAYLYPELRQIFFIGDGRITSGPFAGFTQQFTAPAGTKRLFFGTVDGEGWFNNSGQFIVETVVHPSETAVLCGDTVSPAGVSASDSLAVLRGAVGSGPCSECRCDVDHSGSVVANDALRVLRHAVGQEVDLDCPCCTFN